MAIWELIRETVADAHSGGREWLTVGDITREVLVREPNTNKGTIHALVRYHSINDPSKKHSPGMQYRTNPLFVTDEPTVHGKRFRLLSDQERRAFLAHPRDDLEQYSYAQTLEWLSGQPVELEEREDAPGEIEFEETGAISGTALLELHLQDYLFRNWNSAFSDLRLYEGTLGKEFRTSDPSVGIVDFLCTDSQGNFVVIETKRDMADRRAVGQILGYMGWVAEKLCTDGQSVRGILIAGEASPELKLSVRAVPNLSIQTYEISFVLTPLQ